MFAHLEIASRFSFVSLIETCRARDAELVKLGHWVRGYKPSAGSASTPQSQDRIVEVFAPFIDLSRDKLRVFFERLVSAQQAFVDLHAWLALPLTMGNPDEMSKQHNQGTASTSNLFTVLYAWKQQVEKCRHDLRLSEHNNGANAGGQRHKSIAARGRLLEQMLGDQQSGALVKGDQLMDSMLQELRTAS